MAYDPRCGRGGDFFTLHRLHRTEADLQRLEVLHRLRDDGLPRVWAYGGAGDSAIVVTTWIDGVALDAYLGHVRAGRRPPVHPSHAVRLLLGLAASLGRLHHRLQVTHGDIQPANLILTNHSSRLVPIDFGGAWVNQSAATRVAADGAHPNYAAPELRGVGSADGFAADQFSATVVLYELLTGEAPYGGLGGKAGWPEFASRVARAYRPPSDSPSVASALTRDQRSALDEVIQRGLAVLPEDRFRNRHVWQDALAQLYWRLRTPPRSSALLSWLTRVAGRVTRAGVRRRGETER